MAFRSNGGHIDGADISAYVDEELSSRDTARVYAHLQTCEQCRVLAGDLRATKALVHDLPLMRAPREFTLGPEFATAPGRAPAYTAPQRRWFNFMPAIATSAALLVLLVFVDVSTLGTGSDDATSGVMSGAAQRVDDAAKSSAESQPAILPRSAPPAPGTGGFAPTPQAAAAGAPPPAGTPMPLQAAAPPPPQAPPAAVTPFAAPAPAQATASPPGGRNTAEGVVAPSPRPDLNIRDANQAADDDDGGLSVLRILEIGAAVVLIGSLAGLYLQKRRSV
jgi:hypothetical protein